MNDSIACEVCNALIPIAESHVGKAFGGVVGAAVSSATRNPLLIAIATGVGIAVGHYTVDRVAHVVCHECGTPHRLAA